MPRKKTIHQFDEDILQDIADAVAAGASTNKEIAEAIGWKEATFKTYRYGKTGKYKEQCEPIRAAIKKGKTRQRKAFLSKAENSLEKLIEGYWIEEKEVERVRLPGAKEIDSPSDVDNLNPIEYVTKMKVKKRYIQPNPMCVIFTLCNGDATKWKSISKVVVKESGTKGAILDGIDEMLK